MAEVQRRAPPILYYTAISVGLLGVVVARALDRYQNFFAAAFALSHSNGSILVMANMAVLCLYMFGRTLQLIFFGPLRPVEIERLYQRGGFFVTDFMLAFATFREVFGVSSGVLVAVLLFVKCFHWLLSDRIEAIDQVPYPGPGKVEHARMVALFLALWIVDLILLTYSIDAVMQQGMGLVVLFATEYAILMVSLTQCLLKYILCLYEIRRAAALGGPLAPSWEEKPIYGFYIELSTTFIELLIYVSYFAVMSIFHSIPVYAIRDVYVSGSLFFSRSLAFVRYKRALRALDVFPTPTHEELDSKTDRTCIVCREELTVPSTENPTANTGGQSSQNAASASSPVSEPDMSNGPPKRLPCGHIFHLNCLRSWFERQLTCPTCRMRVDEPQPRVPNANGGIARAEGLQGNQNGDNARPQPGAHPEGADADRARPNLLNRNGGRQAEGTALPAAQMREPLRFEGFYLQPAAFVPWVGGPIIPRDPTAPTQQQQLQRLATGLQQQRTRHTPLPSASSTSNNTQMPLQLSSSVVPAPPAVQSPVSAPGTAPFSQTWPTATSIPSPIPDKIVKPSGTPKRSSVTIPSDGDTSSEESSSETSQTVNDRRRVMAEAALRRHQAGYSRLHSTISNPGTPPRPSGSIMPLSPADHHSFKSSTEQTYNKYFAPQEVPINEGATPTQQWKSYSPNPLRSQVTPTASIGHYTIRNDAPSFIPLFHQFHIPVYGPATGNVRAWPLQSSNLPSQTLPMPSTQNISTPMMPRPGSYRDSRSPSITAGLPQVNQHQNPINPSLLRPSSSLPPRDIKREASPTQELSLRQLDSITRQLIEERLRVLENVKRITQQCIDELTTVRGSPVSLESLRPSHLTMKPLTEQESGSSEAVGGYSVTSAFDSTPPLAPLLSPTSKTDDLLMADFPRGLEPMQSPGIIPPSPLDPIESMIAPKEPEPSAEAGEQPAAVEGQQRIKEESE